MRSMEPEANDRTVKVAKSQPIRNIRRALERNEQLDDVSIFAISNPFDRLAVV